MSEALAPVIPWLILSIVAAIAGSTAYRLLPDKPKNKRCFKLSVFPAAGISMGTFLIVLPFVSPSEAISGLLATLWLWLSPLIFLFVVITPFAAIVAWVGVVLLLAPLTKHLRERES
ncbi:MAG: hypothetical protein AAGF84_06625 [Planctomycetota bacterium]